MSDFNRKDLETLVREVVKTFLAKETGIGEVGNGEKDNCPTSVTGSSDSCQQVGLQDYPLGTKRPELIKTPAGNRLTDITLAKVVEGEIKSDDLRITPETLLLQARIAEKVNRPQFAQNLRRAAELTKIPDQRVLEIYNALRPYRSTKEELLAIADELENRYQAKINAAMVRQAAEVYEKRNRLRK